MKKTVIFYDGNLAALPPLISLMRALHAKTIDFLFVGIDRYQANEQVLADFGARSVFVHRHDYSISYLRHPFSRLSCELNKNRRFLEYRKSLWSVIWNYIGNEKDYVVWTHSTSSAAALGDEALMLGNRHIHTFYELGEFIPEDVPGFNIQLMYKTATFVECEPNRAEIRAALVGMKRIPYVIPNCPFGHPRNRCLDISDPAARAVVDSRFKDKFVFLYQGILEADRSGIGCLLDVLCRNFQDDIVSVMTWGDKIDLSSLKRHNNFVIVPYVKPPRHLEVTSWASVGLAYYSRSDSSLASLNAVYCAPNKIYEYAGFGIPTIGNDMLGLHYTIDSWHAGVCLSGREEKTIVDSIKEVKSRYSFFSCNAMAMYDDADILKRVETLFTGISQLG